MLSNYFEQIEEEVKQYFHILSPDFPDWLSDYSNAPEMQRLQGISMVCGTDYSKIFDYPFLNHTLNHSIGVALIIWHFTHDKAQTLAGLFHDIATPAFKHCIDFMNGDSEHQESTEEKTEEIIKNSKIITSLLHRDNISIEQVSNYKLYPIADNPTPRLSADRFEYTFSNGLLLYSAWDLEEIQTYYQNIEIVKNEDNIDELAFRDKSICEAYFHKILPIFAHYHSDNNRTVMQFWADILKSMNRKGYLTVDDLYVLSESEVIQKIATCPDEYLRQSFEQFQNATSIYRSKTPVKNQYCAHVKGKVRYIVPLSICNGEIKRITDVSPQAAKELQDYFAIQHYPYTGFNFDFKPYA